MLHQYCAGRIPPSASVGEMAGIVQLIAAYREAFDRYDFSTGLSAVWGLISEANKLIVEAKPWELAKSSAPEDRKRLEKTLYTAAEFLRVVSVLLYPVLPDSAKRLWKQLGRESKIEDERIEDDLKQRPLESDTAVGKPEPIFPRLDKEKTLATLEELAEANRERDKPKEKKAMDAEGAKTPSPESPAASPAAPAPSPQSPAPAVPEAAPKISIEDFAKVEMRVGQILTAEPVQGAQKLMKLMVDIGSEVRQVVAGIAEHYKPEQLVGMKVVIVVNLQPRKLRGVESNGMIVAASVGPEGRPVLVTFKEDVEIGARLK
jgi:methionyl-tRNA synthetase